MSFVTFGVKYKTNMIVDGTGPFLKTAFIRQTNL